MRLLPRLAAAAALTLLVAACGSSNDDNGTGSAAGPTTGAGSTSAPAGTTAAPSSSSGGGGEAEIEIESFQFKVPASVSPGQAVKVTNKDSATHTVTSGDKFDSEVGGSGTSTFNAPSAAGTYQLTCKFHANMHGTLVVK
jgi:plastocyanin